MSGRTCRDSTPDFKRDDLIDLVLNPDQETKEAKFIHLSGEIISKDPEKRLLKLHPKACVVRGAAKGLAVEVT
jgi:hypothetical protein